MNTTGKYLISGFLLLLICLFTINAKINANGPIEFYGQILDQYTKGVPGVKVVISVSGYNKNLIKEFLTFLDKKEIKTTSKNRFTLFTDEDGLFSIINKKGQYLRIISWEKNGYVQRPYDEGEGGFFIYKSNSGRKYIPNKNQPVVYHMWKIEQFTQGNESYKIKVNLDGDGTPKAINLKEGRLTKHNEGADILIVLKSDIPKGEVAKKYDWHLKLLAIDGGFIESNDSFLFLAPEGGYLDRFEVIRKKDEPNWTRQTLIKKLYFKGRKDTIFAAIKFTAYAYNSGHGVVILNAIVNQNSSRNLEHINNDR